MGFFKEETHIQTANEAPGDEVKSRLINECELPLIKMGPAVERIGGDVGVLEQAKDMVNIVKKVVEDPNALEEALQGTKEAKPQSPQGPGVKDQFLVAKQQYQQSATTTTKEEPDVEQSSGLRK
ncbi:Uncharacterised protein [Legionella wadsworthii]|uniref:Fir n=1 Tax=Legionella wadsworthii TaxID=28088 RepID=A0A378LU36_9GAMM|nr:hypothetical protein [Legionella wadsworthii]STY30662.1 Uncharacterised protein [Legionella wadsworthii]